MNPFPGTHGKKKLHHLWTEGQPTQELFKNTVSLAERKVEKRKFNKDLTWLLLWKKTKIIF